jgi:hypothetical protein
MIMEKDRQTALRKLTFSMINSERPAHRHHSGDRTPNNHPRSRRRPAQTDTRGAERRRNPRRRTLVL